MLRNYQIRAIEDVKKSFKKGNKRIILCLPTGGGKTLVASNIVAQTLQKNLFSKVLILTDRTELSNQMSAAVKRIGINPYLFNPKNKKPAFSRCIVGMIETVKRNTKSLPENFDLIIIDESHKGNFRKIFELYPNSHIIGLTATPISASKKHPLKDYYQDIVVGTQIPELIELGYLSKCTTFAPKVDTSELKTDWKGEYTNESQNKVFNKSSLFKGVIEKYQRFANNTKAIVFNVNVDHSKNICNEFIHAGYEAKHIDGYISDDERKDTLAWFNSTPNGILCNCDIATTGFDQPDIQTVIVNRATTSLALWLQMVGRGSRIVQDKKYNFTLIDMGNNWQRLGLWEEERDWHEWFFNPDKPSKKAGVAPVKNCPECDAIIGASAKKCLYCEYEFPEKEKELQEAEFIQVVASQVQVLPENLNKHKWQMTVQELIDRAEFGSNGVPYKKGWILHELKQRGKEALKEYAQIMGYKSSWVYVQMKEKVN